MNIWQIALDVMDKRRCDTLEIGSPWKLDYVRQGGELVTVINAHQQAIAREHGLRIIAADFRRETLLLMRLNR